MESPVARGAAGQPLPTPFDLRSVPPHQYAGVQVGYYIGREHAPHTFVKVVKSVQKGDALYMTEVEEGEPGYLICRGKNVMSQYIKNPEATEKAIHSYDSASWYTAFGDICYYLLVTF